MLAVQIHNQEEVHLNLIDIKVSLNAFGRQKDSFEARLVVKGIKEPFKAIFIRAPLILEVGENVEVLAKSDDHIVAARQDNILVTSFHPELTCDKRIHEYFLSMCQKSMMSGASLPSSIHNSRGALFIKKS